MAEKQSGVTPDPVASNWVPTPIKRVRPKTTSKTSISNTRVSNTRAQERLLGASPSPPAQCSPVAAAVFTSVLAPPGAKTGSMLILVMCRFNLFKKTSFAL